MKADLCQARQHSQQKYQKDLIRSMPKNLQELPTASLSPPLFRWMDITCHAHN